MQFLFLSLFAAVIVAADQFTKYLTVANIPQYGQVEVLPGVVSFTYVKNTGAAFSAMQGMRWVFVGIFILLTVAVLWEYFKKPLPFSRFDRFCIAAVYGGGLGNMIDRVRLGYVVDMIKTDFINFPVFNVADCFITCGCILLVARMLLNKKFWKEEKA